MTAPDPDIHTHLQRLRAGDTSAIEPLIELSCDRLRRRTRQMLRSFPVVSKWDQTDDVLQVALVRLCSALRAAPPASPEHFLHLATLQIRRELIDLARHYRGRRDMESLNVEDSKGNEVLGVASPDGAPDGLDEWAAFHEAVGKLPDDERVVVELRWYQELTEEDTARLLDISERTARRRWRDARLRLSERLNGCLPE